MASAACVRLAAVAVLALQALLAWLALLVVLVPMALQRPRVAPALLA